MGTRKYYIARILKDGDDLLGPDIPDLFNWTVRYLSSELCLVRDADGLKDFPVFGVDVGLDNVMDALPVELPLTMRQAEADAACVAMGLSKVDLEALANDRAGGR